MGVPLNLAVLQCQEARTRVSYAPTYVASACDVRGPSIGPHNSGVINTPSLEDTEVFPGGTNRRNLC